jgi:hypothetical protein
VPRIVGSDAGAGLILLGPAAPVGTPLTLELQVHDGEPNGIGLRATVRNATTRPDGTVRVGVEFVPLTPLERSELALLLEREAGIASR